MVQKLPYLILLLLPVPMVSQSIIGKIYDDESTVKGAKILNITKNSITYSDDNGDFKLNASLNDSIVFSSLFHVEKSMALKKSDFDDVMVIELKKLINELDEVLLNKEPDTKSFDVVESNNTLKEQILEDIKRNPHLYQKGSGGGNILAIIGLVAKLFKSKKPKIKDDVRVSVTYAQLDELFKTDSYFNETFLKTELKITEEYRYLFLEFCEAQDIDSKLLLVENRFYMLDFLLKSSTDFLEIVEAYKKD